MEEFGIEKFFRIIIPSVFHVQYFLGRAFSDLLFLFLFLVSLWNRKGERGKLGHFGYCFSLSFL